MDRDVHRRGLVRRRDQPPERAGAAMAQDCRGPRRKHRRHLPRARRHDGADEVDAPMEHPEPAGLQPATDGAGPESQLEELRPGNHPVLNPGQCGNPILDLAAHLTEVPFPVRRIRCDRSRRRSSCAAAPRARLIMNDPVARLHGRTGRGGVPRGGRPLTRLHGGTARRACPPAAAGDGPRRRSRAAGLPYAVSAPSRSRLTFCAT